MILANVPFTCIADSFCFPILFLQGSMSIAFASWLAGQFLQPLLGVAEMQVVALGKGISKHK